MNENDILECLIIDEDNMGNGISKVNNFVIFIKGALKDEKVKIKIITKQKHFGIGELIEVIIPSPKRYEIKCPYYYRCGGCNFLHIKENEELTKKQLFITNLFKEYKVCNIVYDDFYNYRNKVSLHVQDGKIGFFKTNTNSLVEINKCLLISDVMNNLIKKLKDFDLKNITKIVIKEAFYTKEILISFYGSINISDLEKLNKFNIKAVYLNGKLIKYNNNIIEKIGNYKFSINEKSFFQVNTRLMEQLYQKIKEYAGKGNSLLDLYCGTGTIGIFLSDNFKDIVGVEIVKEAIENALYNKNINNINNIKFICGDSKVLKEGSFSCVVVDPPRSGLSKKVIDNIKNINPEKLVYVSCNPLTLKRDLKLLESNFKVLEITPFNMFPRTNNVECCSLLCLKKAKIKNEVDRGMYVSTYQINCSMK